MHLGQALSREYIYLRAVGRTFWRMRHVKPDARYTISDIVEDLARKKPRSPAVLFEDRTLSYADLSEGANRYARWALSQNIRKGDVVALLMANRPEYLMAWLGIVKLGGVVALLNTNLKGEALAHGINVVKAKRAIIGSEFFDNYASALPRLSQHPDPWVTGVGQGGGEDLDAALREQSPAPLDGAVRDGLTAKDNAFYIYTSGTTGLPKAANFSHMRMLYMMFGFAGALGAREDDRMYDPLPLYHSTGGVCAVGVALTAGGALILKRRFSAHEFWRDCRDHRATCFQYIGELCRYLLNTPYDPAETEHAIRAIAGNGLRPEIWPRFQQRFQIPRIVEFYGATEGNVGMLNYDNKVGAVGRIPRYLKAIGGTAIVRFDMESERPVRGSDGFCIECEAGETGEAIGKIRNAPGRGFEGYTQSRDTVQKVLVDVFERGDSWFRTGDLMRQDRDGYFYFVDRIGDTFRWKGENVATSEVAEALSAVPGILEANVYGVSVPGHDGRAGMAALVVNGKFDLPNLATKLNGSLPPYARPLFLRLRPSLEVTGTFKLRKLELVRDGFDPSAIDDPLYWLNAQTLRYERLDVPTYAGIAGNAIRL